MAQRGQQGTQECHVLCGKGTGQRSPSRLSGQKDWEDITDLSPGSPLLSDRTGSLSHHPAAASETPLLSGSGDRARASWLPAPTLLRATKPTHVLELVLLPCWPCFNPPGPMLCSEWGNKPGIPYCNPCDPASLGWFPSREASKQGLERQREKKLTQVHHCSLK